MKKLIWSLVIVLVVNASTLAKDFGKHGATFQIKEEDVIEYIQKRLKLLEQAGELQALQTQAIDKAKDRLRNPRAVDGITNTKEPREFYYDPTYVLKEDIKDHEGKVLYKAGYALNPLAQVSFGEDMIFINGDNEKQFKWAKEYHKAKGAKVILVRGSPLELEEEFDGQIYFDQAGKLTEKLGITQVPAIVAQAGLKLKIKEFKVTEEDMQKFASVSGADTREGNNSKNNQEVTK